MQQTVTLGLGTPRSIAMFSVRARVYLYFVANGSDGWHYISNKDLAKAVGADSAQIAVAKANLFRDGMLVKQRAVTGLRGASYEFQVVS